MKKERIHGTYIFCPTEDDKTGKGHIIFNDELGIKFHADTKEKVTELINTYNDRRKIIFDMFSILLVSVFAGIGLALGAYIGYETIHIIATLVYIFIG